MADFFSYGIDHLNVGVADAERSRDFYAAALAPLGIDLTLSIPHEGCEPNGDQARAGGSMFGFASRASPHKPFFWVLGNVRPGQGLHVAFAAATRSQVDAFHAAALAAGGTDGGGPGIRRYHPAYYGAFVRDPDGHNVEAVCHAPEPHDTRDHPLIIEGQTTMTTVSAADLVRVNPPGLFDPAPFGYSQVVIAPAGGRVAFFSGQGGAGADGALPDGFEAQAAQAFANLSVALDGVGAARGQVASLTIYVVDHDPSRLGALTQAVVEAFGAALPAQTLVPVPRLALDGMLVEVEAVAVLP